jgi:hypothetical protein
MLVKHYCLQLEDNLKTFYSERLLARRRRGEMRCGRDLLIFEDNKRIKIIWYARRLSSRIGQARSHTYDKRLPVNSKARAATGVLKA